MTGSSNELSTDALLNRARMRVRNERRWDREGSPTAPDAQEGSS